MIEPDEIPGWQESAGTVHELELPLTSGVPRRLPGQLSDDTILAASYRFAQLPLRIASAHPYFEEPLYPDEPPGVFQKASFVDDDLNPELCSKTFNEQGERCQHHRP